MSRRRTRRAVVTVIALAGVAIAIVLYRPVAGRSLFAAEFARAQTLTLQQAQGLFGDPGVAVSFEHDARWPQFSRPHLDLPPGCEDRCLFDTEECENPALHFRAWAGRGCYYVFSYKNCVP